MATNKDFDSYASSLFGGEFGKKGKSVFGKDRSSDEKTYHPPPVDVVVLDKNDNVLSDTKKTGNKVGTEPLLFKRVEKTSRERGERDGKDKKNEKGKPEKRDNIADRKTEKDNKKAVEGHGKDKSSSRDNDDRAENMFASRTKSKDKDRAKEKGGDKDKRKDRDNDKKESKKDKHEKSSLEKTDNKKERKRKRNKQASVPLTEESFNELFTSGNKKEKGKDSKDKISDKSKTDDKKKAKHRDKHHATEKGSRMHEVIVIESEDREKLEKKHKSHRHSKDQTDTDLNVICLTSIGSNEEHNLHGKKENHSHKDIKTAKTRTEQIKKREYKRPERNDSGISLGMESLVSEPSEPVDFDIFWSNGRRLASRHGIHEDHEDSDSELDLAYFCVDHMKMCKSRADMRRHRRCKLDVATPTTDENLLPNGARDSKVGLVNAPLRTVGVKPATMDSRASFSPGAPCKHSSLARFTMHTMYRDMLVRLYDYSGIVLEDREDMRAHLQQRKELLEEALMAQVEDVITEILATTDENHEFGKYKQLIGDSTRKMLVLQEILKQTYDSSRTYNYILNPTAELQEIYDLEDFATVEPIICPPGLPPFLSVPRPRVHGEAPGEEVGSSLRHIEFFPFVQDVDTQRVAKSCFTGCAYVHADKLMLADWTNGVVNIINTFGVVSDSLTLEHPPWGAVRVQEDRAAVTAPKAHKIFFIEAEPNLHITGSINTKCECFGICKLNNNYACTCDPWSKSPSVRVFNEDGHLLLKTQFDSMGQPFFKCPLHICADFFNTSMYVSDASADCVFAITIDGDFLFCYQDRDLEYPTGLATDRNNRLYVCGRNSRNIQMISNTGELQETLWDSEGLRSPSAMSFHPHGDHAAVTDLDGNTAMGYWKVSIV
ncbi:hypothetical protein MAR_016136 [Mya arenaria]|uniref:Uncharacterized protein n=1 Tax=Mya arenaria TaxID=6604 RepID=A0ABY7FJ45_MYAAR|nr:hypothetical protein MAR_016136 [Mya arenaria]